MLLEDPSQLELLPGTLSLDHGVAVGRGKALRFVVLLQFLEGALAHRHVLNETGHVEARLGSG